MMPRPQSYMSKWQDPRTVSRSITDTPHSSLGQSCQSSLASFLVSRSLCSALLLAGWVLLGFYEGGWYKIRVVLPATYPYKSPSIGFCTPILVSTAHQYSHIPHTFRRTEDRPAHYDSSTLTRVSLSLAVSVLLLPPPLLFPQHPNVDEASGSVCLDVINQTWSPMFDLVNVFSVFLPQLLLYPNPADPLNRQAAQLLMKDPTAYQSRVKEHVKQHASKDFQMGDESESSADDDDDAGDEDMEEGETDGTEGEEAEEDDTAGGDEDEDVLSDCDDLPTDDPTEQFRIVPLVTRSTTQSAGWSKQAALVTHTHTLLVV